MSYKLSNLAQNDLSQIWLYTLNKWSLTQADRYYEDLLKGISVICSNPAIGKSISEIKETHRVFKIKSHLIVYKVNQELILVDRILHKRMDIENKLVE